VGNRTFEMMVSQGIGRIATSEVFRLSGLRGNADRVLAHGVQAVAMIDDRLATAVVRVEADVSAKVANRSSWPGSDRSPAAQFTKAHKV
jgi:hypothetical protein